MTHRALLTALITAAALSATPASAQNLSGTWQISSETQRGTQNQTLTLTQDGSALTGTISFSFGGRRGGGGGGGPQSIEVEDGMVEGSSFSFTMTLSFQGNSFAQEYSGTVDGDTIEGTIQGGRGGGRPFTGTRGG